MSDRCGLIWYAVVGLFWSRTALQAEILILRQQLNVLPRRSPKRVALSRVDRLMLVGLYRLPPKVLGALTMLHPEAVIRRDRAGFRAYWRWKSRTRPCPYSTGSTWRAFPSSPAKGHSCNPRPHAREEADPTAQPRALSASGRRRRREPDADCALRDKMLHEGIDEHAIAGVPVPIYSVPKTVVDLFRYWQGAGY